MILNWLTKNFIRALFGQRQTAKVKKKGGKKNSTFVCIQADKYFFELQKLNHMMFNILNFGKFREQPVI